MRDPDICDELKRRIERIERRQRNIAVTLGIFGCTALFMLFDLVGGVQWGLQLGTLAALVFGFFAVRHLVGR